MVESTLLYQDKFHCVQIKLGLNIKESINLPGVILYRKEKEFFVL